MDSEVRRLIYDAIDQRISADDFERLQDAILADEEIRRAYVSVVELNESLQEIAQAPAVAGNASDETVQESSSPAGTSQAAGEKLSPRIRLALAACLFLAIGGSSFWIGRAWIDPSMVASGVNQADFESNGEESRFAGHATLRRTVDLKWSEGQTPRFEGDILPNGRLAFDDGVLEIDFFCGANMIIEGPAALSIESDWSVLLESGRVRAQVPPAARGFVVKAADAEIVDLGTEFAVDVGSDHARVEVIDGEVELRGGLHDGQHLLTGEGRSLLRQEEQAAFASELSTVGDLQKRRDAADAQRLYLWRSHAEQLAADPRLIAYYPLAEQLRGRRVENAASSGSQRDGLLVGPVEQMPGRFGGESSGLSFGRTGARVRTRIDGEFRAFSFACWVRIDALPNRYNALFMGDGYENGEPHWQIRDDGCLMFSVMVDDTQDVIVKNEFDQDEVRDAGLHRVYFSEPMWDRSKSGRWFHLGAVYDPEKRQVTHFVNGEPLSKHKIEPKFFVDSLRIGPSEIGNWGQPFRETPWFAVRNFDGVIDEMAIFDAALSEDEMKRFYFNGKPRGY